MFSFSAMQMTPSSVFPLSCLPPFLTAYWNLNLGSHRTSLNLTVSFSLPINNSLVLVSHHGQEPDEDTILCSAQQ